MSICVLAEFITRVVFMNGRQWFFVFCMVPFLALAAEDPDRDGRTVFVQMGIEESFIVKLRPGWRVFRRKSVDLCYEDFLIQGERNAFNLTMQFCYEDPEQLQYDTPEKQRAALLALTASLYDESFEKTQGKPPFLRDFSPVGRSGCALRLTSARWIGKTPPPDEPEGRFVTCGLFRVGENSALFFQLWTNTVDDAAYYDLLDFIAALAIPERGEPNWRLSNAAKAVECAVPVFAKFHPEVLTSQRPFNVHLRRDMWIVSGARWSADESTVNEVAFYGPTGVFACDAEIRWPTSPSRGGVSGSTR